jgi:hypothetical protein
MADKKISDLTALTGANVADTDLLPIVDTSATETKKITFGEFKTALDTSTGFVRITGDTMTGNLSFGNNNKAIFGAGSDLQIFSEGSGGNSFINETGNGSLYINASNLYLRKGEAVFENFIACTANGDVKLYHDNALKLATTATGIDVTGVITTDGMTTSADINFGDNDKAIFGAGSDLQIYHDGTSSTSYFIESNAIGNMEFRASSLRLKEGDGGNYYFLGVAGGASTIYHSGSAKLATTATGIDVTGTVVADGLTVSQGSGANILLESITTGATTGDIFGEIEFKTNDSSSPGIKGKIDSYSEGAVGNGALRLFTGDTTGLYQRMNIASNGDISFYEDTGTTAKFFWDASAESLGIGTSSPAAKLDISNAATGVPILRLSGFATADNPYGAIEFYNTDGSQQGPNIAASIKALAYNGDGSGGQLTFATSVGTGTEGAEAVERVRIDSSGNVIVGKGGGTSNASQGVLMSQTGEINAHKDSSHVLLIDRGTDDGTLVLLRRDGSTVGSIGARGGDTVIASTSQGVRFYDANNVLLPTDGVGAGLDATISLGQSDGRWKDLYLSGGVYLGGTGAANKLDDYEEGTWSIGVTVGGTAQTVSGPLANYTKIGDTVSIRFKVGFSKSGSGVVNITGLPFASGFGSTVSVPIGCQVGSVTSTAALFANIDAATTVVHLSDQAGDLTDADFASTAYIFGSFTYQA